MSVVSLLFAIVMAPVAILFLLGVYARRGERASDVPGFRSAAIIRVQPLDLQWSQKMERVSSLSDRPGLSLAVQLATLLTNDPVVRSDMIGFDSPFWEVYWHRADQPIALQVLLVADDRWLVRAVGMDGAPAPPAVLAELHSKLALAPFVRELSWHPRERALAGDFSGGGERPDS